MELSSVLRRWSWPLRHAPQPVCVKTGAGLFFFKKKVDDEFFATPDDEEFWKPDDYVTGFFVNLLLEVGIPRNDAITENTVALFVCMCIRTATFVSKTSKSLFLSLDLLTGQTAAAEAAEAFFLRNT